MQLYESAGIKFSWTFIYFIFIYIELLEMYLSFSYECLISCQKYFWTDN